MVNEWTHLLFLTTTNFSTNPRLVKEVKLALGISSLVTVVMFRLGNWSDAKSESIASELKSLGNIAIIVLPANKPPLLTWILWGTLEKLSRWIYPLLGNSLHINALANSRRSFQIAGAVKKIDPKPSFICSHNLGTLYPAWRMSKKWHVPFIFDIEDYHPGELIHFDPTNEKHRREFLMKKVLPKATAITSASPLIGEYTMKLIGGHPQHQVILNSFSQGEFIEPPNQQINSSTNQLKLVWFSQKISFGRGLEQLFEALHLIAKEHSSTIESFNLTIIGDLDSDFESKVLDPLKDTIIWKHIHILPPMRQEELHKSLALYDVGLALEFDTADLNRQLCMTNKILAYAQAGLYILATDTPAQKQFIQQHEGTGLLCGQTAKGMSDGHLSLVKQQKAIESNRRKRFDKAQELAWEKDAVKLMLVWEKVKSLYKV